MPFDQKFAEDILPGEEINCRCTEVSQTPEHAEAYR